MGGEEELSLLFLKQRKVISVSVSVSAIVQKIFEVCFVWNIFLMAGFVVSAQLYWFFTWK